MTISSQHQFKELHANEALYKVFIEITGILWGSALVILFYFSAETWVKASTAFILIAAGVICFTKLLLTKQSVADGAPIGALERTYKTICGEFLWKISSLGIVSLVPALAWDLVEKNSISKIASNPLLIPVLLLHFVMVVVCISLLRVESKKERSSAQA